MMFAISGTGSALPRRRIGCAELELMHGLASGTLEAAPGVAFRHYAESETQIDLACQAAKEALEEAGTEDIDLIIHAAAVPYQPIPSTSARIARELGFEDGAIETLDLNATCLSFLTALDKAIVLIAAGTNRRILIISSEISSRGLPWDRDPATAALFGDGAAAAVVEPGDWSLLARRFRTYPSGWEHCQLRSGGTAIGLHEDRAAFHAGSFFEMDGRDIYRATLKHFPRFVDDLLSPASLSIPDFATIIPHQASPHALAHIQRLLPFRDGQLIETIQETGNMISASIPYTLHQARKEGRLARGNRVLLLGTSAGMSLGGLAMERAA